MKQRYNELTHELCVRAALEAFQDKWLRRDVVQLANKYSGVSFAQLKQGKQNADMRPILEAAEGIALELEERIMELLDGDEEALDLEPVKISIRPDGMTGKLREIADLSPMHQLVGHLIKLGLNPLLDARLEYGQCASIPGRGQTGLKRRVERWLRRKGLGIRCAKKTDVKHAYNSLLYAVCIGIIRQAIPAARWILVTLMALARNAPGGHLIIGGYLDAWLFNFVMSYAVRYVLSLCKERRGQKVPLVVRVVTHMDDFGLLGRREADIKSATRKLARWMEKELHLNLKPGKETKFLSVEEEHRRKKAPRPAGRGCPCLDMGGFRVHRTYTTVRKCIYLRARRAYLRVAAEIQRKGWMCIERAYRIGSYFGYYKHTASRMARERLNVDRLTFLACLTVSRYNKRRLCNAA